MTTIWLARHAETATPTMFHGAESDIGLGELGVRQAEAAAGWFRELGPTAVVSSAMRRAVDTAAPIAALCGVPHVLEPDLHERKVGPYSGTLVAAGEAMWTETARRWAAGETAFAFPGMESYDEIRARVVPAFRRVAERFAGGRVVVVAHGVVCKVLLTSIPGELGPGDWVRIGRVFNLAASELVHTAGGWKAVRLLEVPPPVLALTVEPTTDRKSEA